MANPKKKFSKIYNQYVEKIYRFVFLKVNSRETAEDLTSKVFLKGWEAFKNQKFPTKSRILDGKAIGTKTKNKKLIRFASWRVANKNQKEIQNQKEIKNPQAFLYQIARNLVIDYYREKGRTQIVSTEFVPQIADLRTNLEETAKTNSDLEIVKQAMQNLKGDYQEIIIWHYLDDLSISEIAGILNKQEGAVRVMLHRALKVLKNELS